jgi:hypothetical protein
MCFFHSNSAGINRERIMTGSLIIKRTTTYSLFRRGWCSFFLCAICSLIFVSAAHAQWDSVTVLTHDDRNYIFFGQLVVDDSFRLHVFANRSSGPHTYQPTQLIYQQFDNWGNPLTEIMEISPEGQRDDYGLAVLLGRNNWIHVVWNRIIDDPPVFESRWMYMKLNTDGEVITPPTQLPNTDPSFGINYEVNMIQDSEGIIWISFFSDFIMAIDEFGEEVVPMHRVLPDINQSMLSMFVQRTPSDEIWACGRHLGEGNEDILLVRLDTTALVSEEVMEQIAPPPAVINLDAFFIDLSGAFHYNIYVEGEGNFYARDCRDGNNIDSVQIAPTIPYWSGMTNFIQLESDTLQFVFGTENINRTLIPMQNDTPTISVHLYPINELFYLYRFPRCVEKGGSQWILGTYQEDFNEPLQIAMIHIPGPNEPPPNAVDPSYPVIRDHRIISVYPNPFNSIITLSLSLSAPQNTNISLYDITGRHVKNISQGLMPAGDHSLKVDAAGLPSGTYFVKVDAAGFNVTRSITLIR